MVAPVGHEVAGALELHVRLGRHAGQRWLHLGAGQHLQRVRVQHTRVILGVVGLGDSEERVVQPHLGVDRVGGGDPVDGPFHLAALAVAPASRDRTCSAPRSPGLRYPA